MKKVQRLLCILLLFSAAWGNGCTAFAQSQLSIPQDVVSQLRTKAHITFIHQPWSVPPQNGEYAAAVQPDGSVDYFMLGANGEQFRIPANTVLVLHTHPITSIPTPSVTDRATATKHGIPICVVTQYQVSCALPDGSVEQIQ